MPQLHKVPNGTKIKVVDDTIRLPPEHRIVEEGEVLMFSHIDGMYSLCTDKDGNYVHLAAWTEVEVVDDD